MLWTVVGIAPGVGPTGRGAGPPLSLAGRYRETPTPPAHPFGTPPPTPQAAGQCVAISREKPDPGHDATEPGGLPVATPEMPSWKI
jgi:hypothetical protein